MRIFESVETVWFFVALVGGSIVGYIKIPPGVVIIDAIPSVGGQRTVIGRAVHNVAGDVLTTTEGSEKIGEVVADAFMGAQCFANVEILDECAVVIVVLEVMDDPLVDCSDLIFVGFATGADFVSKFFCLCVPQGCPAVGEIRGFRFADEIVCGDPCDQNKTRYYQNIDFRQ